MGMGSSSEITGDPSRRNDGRLYLYSNYTRCPMCSVDGRVGVIGSFCYPIH